MSAGELARELRSLPRAAALRRVEDRVLRALADFLGHAAPEDIDPAATFLDLGFDSLRAVDFKDALAAGFGCELRTTLVFDHPTPRAVAAHLTEVLGLAAPAPGEAAEDDDMERLSAPELRARLRALEARAHEPIAIVGLGCRFPGGASSPEAFWRLMRSGADAVTEIPAARFPIDRFYDPDHQTPGKIATRYGAFIDGLDRFDARFFGMSAREANELDPRQRILLETVWETLEHGGQSPDLLRGRAVGVYVGILSHEYFDSQTDRDLLQCGRYNATGAALSTAAGRISYALGWTGPSLALDTACSSSLVAVHLAVQSLRRGECELALAAGVNALIDPVSFLGVSQANMLASDGRCKTFDARGDGYVRSEGCGAVLLKPLSRAQADGDRILAVIRGTAANQDGASGGLTVPHGPSQSAVIRAALADGRVAPAEVSYVEAHGTGTSLGDPIEAGALDEVFGPSHGPGGLLVGSVKTNIGHGEPAAGVAGLIKLVLALEHGELPRNLHFETPTPHIPWERSVVRVPTVEQPWPRGARPRVAGVSSFGFSGTNAHVVVAEAPQAPPVRPARRPLCLPLSAATPEALQALIEAHRAALPGGDEACADHCYTAAVGRAHLPHRAVFVAADAAELGQALGEAARDPAQGVRGDATGQAPRVAFLFTGQGSQVAGMARELHAAEPAFRAALDACAEGLARELDRPLFDVLWGPDSSNWIDRTEYAQPALFAVEYALARMFESFGVRPALLLGHSVGEVVAAVVAGVLSLADGLKLIAARGRLMLELCPPGEMLAVFGSEAEVAPFLAGREAEVSIAAVNGPANTVLSGAPAALAELRAALERAKLACAPLSVSRAFHSPLIEPMMGAFERVVRSLELREPAIPVVSCLTGETMGRELADPAFWVRHVRAPVRFQAAMEALAREGARVLLELGPQPVLLGMARRFLKQRELAWVPSLRRAPGDWAAIASSLAELHARGVPLDWSAVMAGDRRRRVDLPSYPFQRERYWYERRTGVRRGDGPAHPLLGRPAPSAVLAEGQLLFEGALSVSAPAFLAEHTVFGAPIVPAAALLEMALAAGASAFGQDVLLELAGVAVQEALPARDEETEVELVLDAPEDGARAFRIYSLRGAVGEEPAWTLHASGRVRPRAATVELPTAPAPEELAPGRWNEIAPERFYAAFADAGLAYGPLFRGVRELRARPGEALARVRLPDALAGEAGPQGFRVHPALLDACLQTSAAALVGDEIDALFLPLGIQSVSVHGPVPDQVLCRTRVTEGTTRERAVRLDLDLFHERGGAPVPVLSLRGLQLVRADAALLHRAKDAGRSLLYAVHWQPAPAPEAAAERAGAFALVGGGELASALAAELARRGHAAVALGPDEARRLASEQKLASVVFLDGVGAAPGDEARLLARAAAVAQAALACAPPPHLWLVTRGAEPAGGTVQPAGAALAGFGNALALEHPELALRRIDLDPAGGGDEAAALAGLLLAPDAEDRVALRGGGRLVPRLARLADLDGQAVPDGPFELRAAEYGSLEHLALRPLARRAPGPGEIEVELAAAALNFKDVLHALGMLQAWSEARGVRRAPDQPLGFEGAGTVVRAGPGAGFAPGDAVVLSWPGALATHATVPARACFAAPQGLDAAEAAGLPTVFQTALYALERCARLRAGERVLIHAAAGGVGQAALQVARRAGATVYATASPGKHAFLRAQGVEHVFNSRSLDFAEEVRAATGGEGVDVVLDSLAGEHVDASLACLKRGGRFVEIGKLGVKTPEAMRAARPDVAYFLFDLSETFAESPELLPALQADLAQGFAQGTLRALPTKRFPARRAREAFRYLAQAKNVGKVVLTLPAGGAETPVRGDRTYLVTGGLGALGLAVARRLVADGARHLVLCGRRAAAEQGAAVQAAVAELERAGATVRTAAVDAARRDDVQHLLAAVARELPPLAGVVHCAGVLSDGMVLQLGPEKIAPVLAPKVDGARHLDELTRGLPLDFFVLFSSMAAPLGAEGQAVYAAANAVMDALAERRAAEGLPALSIQWGPWSGGGMAASRASRNQVRFAQMGLASIPPEQGAALFARLLSLDRPVVAVLPITWSKFLRRFARGGPPPFYAAFAATAAPAAAGRRALLDDLAALAPEERVPRLARFLEQELVRVLGFPAATRVDPRRGFSDLGVDSLLAVDLRNRLESALDASLPATLLFDHPSLEALVAHLAATVLPDAGAPRPAAQPAAGAAQELAALDEAELARRLAEELSSFSGKRA